MVNTIRVVIAGIVGKGRDSRSLANIFRSPVIITHVNFQSIAKRAIIRGK